MPNTLSATNRNANVGPISRRETYRRWPDDGVRSFSDVGVSDFRRRADVGAVLDCCMGNGKSLKIQTIADIVKLIDTFGIKMADGTLMAIL